jgi:peptidoglycan/LPS O-acetylase OafA/YrhL
MKELLDDIITEEQYLKMKRNRISIGFILVQLMFAVLATTLAFYDIQTIIGTGPIGSIIGLIVFAYANEPNIPSRKKIGLSAPIFSLFCFSLVFFLDWSKTSAQFPVSTLMTFYTAILAVFVLLEITKFKEINFR